MTPINREVRCVINDGPLDFFAAIEVNADLLFDKKINWARTELLITLPKTIHHGYWAYKPSFELERHIRETFRARTKDSL